MKKSKFKNISIEVKPISKEYEEKWGQNLNVGEYIISAEIMATK